MLDDNHIEVDVIDDEQERVRRRVHNLADLVQRHEIEIATNKVQVNTLTQRIDSMMSSVATGEQLKAATLGLEIQLISAKSQLEGAVRMIEEKVKHVHEDLQPIQRGIYWVVTLIIGAVILAVLALVFKGGKL